MVDNNININNLKISNSMNESQSNNFNSSVFNNTCTLVKECNLIQKEESLFATKVIDEYKLNVNYIDIYKLSKDEKIFNSSYNQMQSFCNDKKVLHCLSKKDFFDSKNVKELCRKGICYKHFRLVVQRLFKIDNEESTSFEVKKIKVFKDRNMLKIGEYVPYFTNYNNLKQSLPEHYLNEKGIQSVKEIQWLLCSVIPSVQYCPLLIRLNSLLHMFFEPYEVYFILRNILNINYSLNKDLHLIRWHIRFDFEDNYKLISSIIDSYKELNDKSYKLGIENLETKLDINLEAIVSDMVFNLFMGYFNFEGVYRVLVLYLREGSKIFFRIIFEIFRYLSSYLAGLSDKHISIIANNSSTSCSNRSSKELYYNSSDIEKIKKIKENKIKELIKLKTNEIKDFQSFINRALNLNITRNNNKYVFQECDANNNKIDVGGYHIPTVLYFNDSKKLMNDELIMKLWYHFPIEYRLKDLSMIYSSRVDGFSLKNIFNSGLQLIEKNLNNVNDYNTLFIIETKDNLKIGGVLSRLIFPTKSKNDDNPQNAYLISFEPEFRIYNKCVEDHLPLLHFDNNSFLYGITDEGCAISFNSDVKNGFSKASNSFKSPSLSKNISGEIFITNLEVYILC